jgi:ferredoxin
MSALAEEVRREARQLLEAKAVDIFVGYEEAGLPLRRRACFVRVPERAARLVWDRACAPNLAAFLPQLFRKPVGVRGPWAPPEVGVLVKACDSRALAALVRAHQIPRDKLRIIGVYCEGMVDRHKVTRQAEGEGLREVAVDGAKMRLTTSAGKAKVIETEAVLADCCLECAQRDPVGCDRVLGEAVPAPAPRTRYANVLAFEAKSPQERWEAFQAEVSRCIRCYACRQACPNCYCLECFAEETAPCWLGVTCDPEEAALFHLGRALHQAGRCVDCGACVAACPQGLDLRLLTRKTSQDVAELFGAEGPPTSPEEPEVLCAFRPEDDQSFMTEP